MVGRIIFISPFFNLLRALEGLIQKLSVNSKPSWLASCSASTLARKNLVSNLFGSIVGVIQCAQGTIFLTFKLKDSKTHRSLKVMSFLLSFFLNLLSFSASRIIEFSEFASSTPTSSKDSLMQATQKARPLFSIPSRFEASPSSIPSQH